MAKASNNDFPSILMTEQAVKPSAPAAGKWRIYPKTDHKFYWEDSGGTETEIGGGGGDVATDTIWDAAGDLVQGTGADAAAKLTIGTANQLLRVNSGATAVEWASIGRVLITQSTPTGTGTVTFSSIPAGYISLELEIVVRTDKASVTSESLYLYFNNDTTAGNYRRESLTQTSTTVAGGAADNPDGLIAIAADGLADNASYSTVKVPFYASTTFQKVAMIHTAYRTGASSSATNLHSIFWENTAAINRIDIVSDSGGNYIAGTTIRLYGVY